MQSFNSTYPYTHGNVSSPVYSLLNPDTPNYVGGTAPTQATAPANAPVTVGSHLVPVPVTPPPTYKLGQSVGSLYSPTNTLGNTYKAMNDLNGNFSQWNPVGLSPYTWNNQPTADKPVSETGNATVGGHYRRLYDINPTADYGRLNREGRYQLGMPFTVGNKDKDGTPIYTDRYEAQNFLSAEAKRLNHPNSPKNMLYRLSIDSNNPQVRNTATRLLQGYDKLGEVGNHLYGQTKKHVLNPVRNAWGDLTTAQKIATVGNLYNAYQSHKANKREYQLQRDTLNYYKQHNQRQYDLAAKAHNQRLHDIAQFNRASAIANGSLTPVESVADYLKKYGV